MKKIISIFILSALLFSIADAQRVRGKIRKGASDNEIIISIRPTQEFAALMSNLIVSVQIPKAAVSNVRPAIAIQDLQPSLFAPFAKLDQDQGDEFYTWGFNTVDPPHPATTIWPVQDIDVLKVTFLGNTVPPFSARLCHYLDGGVEGSAIFYVETNLAAINGGVLSDWGSLFIGPDAVNGSVANGNIGVPNATYSYAPLSGITLPVNFRSFYAIKTGDDAKLTWDVSSDEKNNYFEVLRSADGRNFKTIQRVNALGNGRSENSYQAADLSLSKLGTREVFYQIQQFDKDGQSIMSPVRKLSIDGLGKSVTAFPNPARTTTKVVVDAPEAGKGSLIMRDAAGRQVQVVNAQFNRGINQFDMNVMSLSSGEYNIQVQGGGLNETIKVTKIN
jgi:hypothetical protein